MKRLILLAAFLLAATALSAQNCIVVNSEKVFKSIDAYNEAIAELREEECARTGNSPDDVSGLPAQRIETCPVATSSSIVLA